MEKLKILFEDENIVVVSKPSGMLSVSYPGSTGKTALDVLEEILRKKGTVNSHRHPLPVHRLDRDTSGVMMFALNEKIQKQIMDDWQNIVTERKYIAVAENPKKLPHSVARKMARDGANKNAQFKKPLVNSGIIDLPLAYNARNQGYVPSDDENVETVEARTNYKILVRGTIHSLFELELDTGRKNQIRAHLSHFGYPLAGDENYRAKTNPFGRLALHARTLAFVHPVTNKKMRFEVEEPKEWAAFVKKENAPKNPQQKTSQKPTKKNDDAPLQRRMTRKEASHLNFIEQGRRKSR